MRQIYIYIYLLYLVVGPTIHDPHKQYRAVVALKFPAFFPSCLSQRRSFVRAVRLDVIGRKKSLS